VSEGSLTGWSGTRDF